jgi:hypothetical protein
VNHTVVAIADKSAACTLGRPHVLDVRECATELPRPAPAIMGIYRSTMRHRDTAKGYRDRNRAESGIRNW